MADEARYLTIERWLEQQCETAGIGSLLPSEIQVAQQFGVSRMTARKAFERLVEQGRIERRRGLGTIVLAPALHRQDSVLRPFSDEIRRRGMHPTSLVITARIEVMPDGARRLGLAEDSHVVHIERVRCADGVPVALEKTVLPEHFSPVLDADLERGSLHAAIASLNEEPSHAQGQVHARLATAREAELLAIELPAALLIENRTITNARHKVIESTETAYIGSRWVMSTGSFVAPSSSKV